MLVSPYVASASDKSISYENTINEDVIKTNYSSDLETFENFEDETINMDPQEIANMIEVISQRYDIDISSTYENVPQENNALKEDKTNDIIDYSSDDDIIVLIKFSGKIKIEDIIDLYKLDIVPYSQESGNLILAKVKTENIEKLESYSFIKKI